MAAMKMRNTTMDEQKKAHVFTINSTLSGFTGRMTPRRKQSAKEFARTYYPNEYDIRGIDDDCAEVFSRRTGRKIAMVTREELFL
jgi:hypothetical protein